MSRFFIFRPVFAGVIAILIVIAGLVAWAVEPLPTEVAVPAAAGLCVFGFLGDITVSAMKRDVGIKDSGTVIPGQGGILDRHDSLLLNAPLFAWLMYLWFK